MWVRPVFDLNMKSSVTLILLIVVALLLPGGSLLLPLAYAKHWRSRGGAGTARPSLDTA